MAECRELGTGLRPRGRPHQRHLLLETRRASAVTTVDAVAVPGREGLANVDAAPQGCPGCGSRIQRRRGFAVEAGESRTQNVTLVCSRRSILYCITVANRLLN